MSQPIPKRRRIHRAEPPVAPAVRSAVAEALAAVAPVRKDKALPLLQQIQARLGSLPAPALACASRASRIPLADLNALVGFYDLLSTDDDCGAVMHLCDDLVCRHAPGAVAAMAERLRAQGCTVRHSPCLGQCDRGPAALETRPARLHARDVATDPAVMHARDGATAPTLVHARDAATDPAPIPHAYGGYASWTLHADPATRRGWPEGYTPLLLANCGAYTDMPGYRAAGGLQALATARAMTSAAVVALVKSSKLVGRGGAAFPTGIKWEGVLTAPTPLGPGPDGARKYVVVNADESEPGTFTNRMLMEDDPFGVIEAALIAAHAVGAQQIYIYIRGEYPLAIERLHAAIHAFEHSGLTNGVALEVRCGGGRYICGEETALFASIEGERGTPRVKPPFPTTHGLFGRPTLINNVETLHNLLPLLTDGVAAWNAVEPKLFSISGDVRRPGVYEVPMGTSLAALITLAGGPTAAIQAVLMGGASGMFLGPEALKTPLEFKAMAAAGATLGSGAVMVFDHTVDLWDIARRAAHFFAEESCGKCVPCRVGTARQVAIVDRFAAGDVAAWLPLHEELSLAMVDASICGLGQTAMNAVRSLLKLKGVSQNA